MIQLHVAAAFTRFLALDDVLHALVGPIRDLFATTVWMGSKREEIARVYDYRARGDLTDGGAASSPGIRRAGNYHQPWPVAETGGFSAAALLRRTTTKAIAQGL